MLLFQQTDHEVQIKQRIHSNYQMLKHADVARQALKKIVYFSVIKGYAPTHITGKSNDPQTRGRAAKLKMEFSRIGSHSHCSVGLSQQPFGHSKNNSTIRALKYSNLYSQQIMNTFGNLQRISLLTSTLDGGEWLTSHPVAVPWERTWMPIK